jgi:hypothetical protein
MSHVNANLQSATPTEQFKSGVMLITFAAIGSTSNPARAHTQEPDLTRNFRKLPAQ